MKPISHCASQWHQVKQALLLLSDVQTMSCNRGHQSLRCAAVVRTDRYIWEVKLIKCLMFTPCWSNKQSRVAAGAATELSGVPFCLSHCPQDDWDGPVKSSSRTLLCSTNCRCLALSDAAVCPAEPCWSNCTSTNSVKFCLQNETLTPPSKCFAHIIWRLLWKP